MAELHELNFKKSVVTPDTTRQNDSGLNSEWLEEQNKLKNIGHAQSKIKELLSYSTSPNSLAAKLVQDTQPALKDSLIISSVIGAGVLVQGALESAGGKFKVGGNILRRVLASELENVASTSELKPAAEKIVRTLSNSEEQNIRNLVEDESNYKVIGKMERGTRGAWLIGADDGSKRIFKLVSKDNVTGQIKASADSAAAVNSLSSPTPRYERVEFTPPFGSWYIQELLPGIPAPAPSDKLIAQLVSMNDRQADKAVMESGSNWSERIMSALYKDSNGWQKQIAASGAEGKALVDDLSKLVDRNRFLSVPASDIVHGDFQHYNALVSKSDRLTAYVDWEGAGKGDRGIDLSRLLYDAYVSEAEIGYKANPLTLQMLSDRLKQVSGQAAHDNFMAYWILQVADYGLSKGGHYPNMFMGVGRRILSDIGAQNRTTLPLIASGY